MMKWSDADYRTNNENRPLIDWKPPPLVYPCGEIERSALKYLRDAFTPLPPYRRRSDHKTGMEWHASESGTLVHIDTPLPDGHIAFLENISEQCTSPETKHSRDGMQSAKHWVQRVDTPEGAFKRLTDGYGISLMFGERFHQFIRNSNNWRGISGVLLDIDVFRDEFHPKAPEPVYSLGELLDRYPLLSRICSFIMPSASSLYEGRPFKTRGIVLFDTPITDQRVYRAFGDTLLTKLDCIPANVTKTPVAVGFGNTHNAYLAWRNTSPDKDWIAQTLIAAEQTVIAENAERLQQRKASKARQRAYQERKRNASPSTNSTGEGENISTFIEKCDPVAEMLSDSLITSTGGTQYRWHESAHDRSCDILDGTIHIFSNTMSAASPASENEPVGTHRFYLYYLSGLDMTKAGDRPKLREFLFERGYGSDPKAFTQGKHTAKLQRADDFPSEKLENLDENRDRRESATDTFLATEGDDSLHILLVKDATGTGKSHTTLAKSKQHNKRTLMTPPHNELAAQAVETARDHGFENPFHLLGREHNWDASGIAEIPVAERTAELFDRNNCIMVDQIKKYTDKRLAPRTYCEHSCPFREGCPHLAQYKGLGQRDFIASSTPGLLFDLNMRGYLESLVTATDENSDEDIAIDAILGTESKATPEFDFAILDDYGVSALYTEISFSESDFKALKNAWKGTPTGEFAKLILKAFDKRKPHKIIKELRKAFESTADHHTEIAKCLTQHARLGTIEYTEHPKSSRESKRLLTEKIVRYTDGGLQFIPLDFDAYRELIEKGLPSVNPQLLETQEVGKLVRVPHTPTHALAAGVPLNDLTPVWQTGATPIDLIRIFLDSIGNDKNAPINRTFRVGDPPVAILTFSVPPQAPIGIIPQIAMLSATTNTDDTQRAFDGQAVSFSEHVGGQLEWADGVEVYQFQDARLTSGSIFEYLKDADGKRILQSEPTGLTATAEQRITKLNDWAKQTEGITAFISYKDFVERFTDHVDGFNIVTHFDKVAGLNFDGLKLLVVFGYPKVRHSIVVEHTRKQHSSDSTPLPKGTYDELTEVHDYQDNRITINERRYKDPRLEKIRLQLSIEKLEQAIGRARLPRWTDTTTVIFTNAPVNATSRATLFTDAAFKLASAPSELSIAIQQIINAEQSGDVKAVMETKGVSKRTAERETKNTRDKAKAERDDRIIELHGEGKSIREIESIMKTEIFKVSRPTINRVIKVSQKRQRQLDILIGDVANETPPKNVDETGVQGDLDENNTNTHHPVPKSEYSKLTECEAHSELAYCDSKSDYAGAALLRSIIKQRGLQSDTKPIE